MTAAVQQPPASSGIVMANWYWRVVRRFALDRFGIGLSRSSCLNWLHRLGFAFKRPKKRLLKADEAKREAFVAEFVSRASTKHTSGAEQKCTTREVIGQRKCPRQLFGRSVTEAGWQQAGRVSE